MKETFPEDTRIDFLIERLETTLRDLEVSINLDTVTNTILFAIHRDISKRTFSFGLVRQYLPE